jgi:hypothetical protein
MRRIRSSSAAVYKGRLGMFATLVALGQPMIYMDQEFNLERPRNVVAVDWPASLDQHGFYQWCRRLVRLRRRYPGLRLRGFDPAAAGQFEWILGPWLDESYGGGHRTVGWRAHPNDRPTDTLAVLLNFESSTYRSTWNSAGRGPGSSWPTSTGSTTCPPMAPTTRTTRPPCMAPTAAWPASPSPARAASSTNGRRPSRHPVGLARPPIQAAMWDPTLLQESGATMQGPLPEICQKLRST